MSRQPLRTIPIFYDPEGENAGVKELKKPSGKLSTNSSTSCSTNTSTVIKKHRARSDGSGGKSSSTNKVRTSETAATRIPFTIFEDENSVGKGAKTPSSRKTIPLGERPKHLTGNSGEKTPVKLASFPGSKSAVSSRHKTTEPDWKKIAEERRLVLEQALKENEMLYDIMKTYQEENEHLAKLVKEGEFLAELVEELTERERAEIVHEGTQTDL